MVIGNLHPYSCIEFGQEIFSSVHKVFCLQLLRTFDLDTEELQPSIGFNLDGIVPPTNFKLQQHAARQGREN